MHELIVAATQGNWPIIKAHIERIVRGYEAYDGVVFACGLQILADGHEVDVRRAQIVHQLQHFAPLFAEANHDSGLGEDVCVQLLHAL